MVGDHLPRDAPDHQPAALAGPPRIDRGIRLEDAADPAGERIVVARRGDEAHRPDGTGHKQAPNHAPRPPRKAELVAYSNRRKHRGRRTAGEAHIGRPRLQQQEHAAAHDRRRDRRPPPHAAERHDAKQAKGQGEVQKMGEEVHIGHEPHHGLHRVAAVDAEAVLREQLPPADPAIGERGHDRHLRERLLPARHERQQQARDAKHQERGECLEDVGKPSRHIEREEKRDRRDRGIRRVADHERVTEDRSIERPARDLPRDHRHERQRHEEHREERQQPRDQRLVIDAHIPHEPKPDEQKPKQRVNNKLHRFKVTQVR